MATKFSKDVSRDIDIGKEKELNVTMMKGGIVIRPKGTRREIIIPWEKIITKGLIVKSAPAKAEGSDTGRISWFWNG